MSDSSRAGSEDIGTQRAQEYRCDMVEPALLEQAKNLSVDERLELIGVVWDSIDHSNCPVSPAVVALIEERVTEAKANPDAHRPLDEVRQTLRGRRGR